MSKISDVYELTSTSDTGGIEKATDAIEKLDKSQESVGDHAQKSAIDYTRLNSAVELGTKVFGVAQQVIEQTIGKALEMADGIDALSQNLGISAEEASKLSYATNIVGISQEQLAVIMKGALTKGIDISLAGMGKLADQYNAIEDPIKRSQFLIKNFGEQGLAMGDLLERGADGINELAGAAEDYGVVLDDKAIQATKDFNIELKELKASAEGAELKVGMAFVKLANKTFNYYETMGKEMQGVSERETQLRQLIIANAWAYGDQSVQVRALSEALRQLLIDQEKIKMTQPEAALRSNMAAVKELNDTYVAGSHEAMKEYYEGFLAANTVISDADKATRSLTLGTQDLTKAFIYQQATQKLAPEAALQLGVAMGIVKQETLNAVTALDLARKQYDSNRDGILDASEAAKGYVGAVGDIERAIAALQNKKVEVTVTTINEYIDKYNKEVNAERPTRGGAQDDTTVQDTLRNRGLK